MNVPNTIAEIESLAQELTHRAAETSARKELEGALVTQPLRRAAIEQSGFHFHEEGAETRFTEAEVVTVPVRLPSREIEWRLRNHGDVKYRVFIETDGPSVVSAWSGAEEPTANTMDRRRIQRYGVFNVGGPAVRIESSRTILRLKVYRYTKQLSGELILGPFHFDGVVRAKAVGYGSFRTRVASDYIIDGEIEARPDSTHILTTRSSATWISEDSLSATTPILDGVAWSAARLIERGLDSPHWSAQVLAGRAYVSGENVTFETPHRAEDAVKGGTMAYWAGLGDWAVLGRSDTPSFDPVLGYWTYVWGSVVYDEEVSGPVTAYDMRTGRKTDPSTYGFYLVKCYEPSGVTIDGIFGYCGEPMRSERDPLSNPYVPRYVEGSRGNLTLRSGDYRRVVMTEAPTGVLVRVRGTGQLRAIEFEIESTAESPDGRSVVRVHREDLSQYWAASDAPPLQSRAHPDTSGPGVLLSAHSVKNR